tara:strand:- start:241 stop:618 length:378 start_codon:yes stop_codon:yes gene_type:complete
MIPRNAQYAVRSALIGLIGLGAVGCKDGSIGDLILDGPKEAVSNAGSNAPDVARGVYVDATRRNLSDIGHEVDRLRVDLPSYGEGSKKARRDVADKAVYDTRKTARKCIDTPARCLAIMSAQNSR